MSERALVRLADFKRAIRGAKDSGLTIREILIQSDGVRLIMGEQVKKTKRYNDPRLMEWPEDDEYQDPRIEKR